jgi:hypothetical protein
MVSKNGKKIRNRGARMSQTLKELDEEINNFFGDPKEAKEAFERNKKIADESVFDIKEPEKNWYGGPNVLPEVDKEMDKKIDEYFNEDEFVKNAINNVLEISAEIDAKNHNKVYFEHKENGNIYEIVKLTNIEDIPCVIYKEKDKDRIYTRDFFMFSKNMKFIEI